MSKYNVAESLILQCKVEESMVLAYKLIHQGINAHTISGTHKGEKERDLSTWVCTTRTFIILHIKENRRRLDHLEILLITHS